MTAAPGLVGREVECRRIADLLARARRHESGALVLSGEAGIGKSALCAWAAAHEDAGRVLSVRGAESEADLPFAGLADLFATEVDRVDRLAAPQGRALSGALAQRDAPRGDRFAIGAAVLSLLAVIGDGEPLLVVVDDAQWLDASSTDALTFAARRLHREAVVMLIAVRPGFALESARLERVSLHGLPATAARELLAAAHGEIAEPVASLLVEHTGGNPLALLEVPQRLSRAQLLGHAIIDEPLPLDPTLAAALLQRLSGLSDASQQALLIAAASGSERVQPVLDALSAIGLDPGVLGPAESAGAVSIAGATFAFRHPLLRSALYHRAGAPERRGAHEALARVTTGSEQTWHRAQATVGEDEVVAAALEVAGREARRRGAPAAAAAAFKRAADLSAPGEARARRHTEAARDACVAGRADEALSTLDEGLKETRDPVRRAALEHVRGRVLVLKGRSDEGHRLLVSEGDRIRDLDPRRSATMLAEACIGLALCGDMAKATAVARDAVAVAERADPDVQAFARVILALTLVMHGEGAGAGELLDAVLPFLRVADPLTEGGYLVSVAAQAYFWLERHDTAAELLDRLIATARRASAPTSLLLPLCCRAELDLRLGRWSVALAEFDEASQLGVDLARPVFAAYATECLARIAAARGEEQRCRDYAAQAIVLCDAHDNEFGRLYVYSAVGLLELGLGRPEAAIASLELAREHAERHELGEPNIVHWQADLVEAYVRAGRDETAAEHLAVLERGSNGRWARGTAARCRGLLADESEPDACFAAALEDLHALRSPFEIARTHLCHGERLRRAGRRTEARRALGLAIDGFERLGAQPWAARGRTELRATGATARRRSDDPARQELTAHELQVARVVAAGASNKEAAAALFISTKTIEFHLVNIYRKLDVRTRTELSALAARNGWLDTNSA